MKDKLSTEDRDLAINVYMSTQKELDDLNKQMGEMYERYMKLRSESSVKCVAEKFEVKPSWLQNEFQRLGVHPIQREYRVQIDKHRRTRLQELKSQQAKDINDYYDK